jgi:type I restriction enzyme S subunit
MSDWSTVTLGDLGEAIIGLTYSPSQISIDGTLVLRSSNIQNGLLDLEDTVRVTTQIPDKLRLQPSDVLICVRNGSRLLIGKSLYLDERVAGETFGAFMALFRSPLNPYLRFFFESDSFRRQIEEHLGATINQITNKSLKGFKVTYPPHADERARITSFLVDASNLVVSLERLISKKRDIKQGMMQELLTGRTRLPDFNHTWMTKRLSTLGSFLRGRGVRRDDVRSSGVPCIRYGEIYTTYNNYTSSTVSFVDSAVAATALPIHAGDVLFAGSGETKEEIGMSIAYIGSTPAVAGGDIIVFRGAEYDPVYLASLLNTPGIASQKARGGQGDAVVHINWKVLASLELTLPELTEQRAIASVLMDSDTEIEVLERRLNSARAIKTGMMQELLSGRTRLPVEELVA